jgi:DNA processing protein
MEKLAQSKTQTDETSAWLLLIKTPGLGPVRIRKLIRDLGTPSCVFASSRQELKQFGVSNSAIRWLKQATTRDISHELVWLNHPQHHCITLTDSHYPELLADIHDAPPVLFVKGDPVLLGMPQLAIVGSRNPSIDGKQTAFQFSQFLASGGLQITSGLAQGIDACSHKGALSNGKTVAVCATGLDRVYPAQHHALAQTIADKGALVSEFLPGTEVHKAFFPRRNRLISGLSLGTLVVEASLHSGSLITAQCALEQGREVFAIPGSIHNPMSKGCHRLIKQGAKLVESADDIIEELQSQLQQLRHGLHFNTRAVAHSNKQKNTQGLDKEYKDLLECIGYAAISIDEMVDKTGLKAEDISSMLLILELDDLIKNEGSGRYKRS